MSLPAAKAPASRGGDGFAGKVAVLIAILATIGTLFGFIGNSSYNEAALLKNNAAIDKTSAANAWNHYQAKSNKQNLAELATNLPGVDHVHYRAEVQRRREDLGAADDAGFVAFYHSDGRFQRRDGIDAVMLPVGVAGDDDVLPAGKRPADRVEGLAAHDDRAAERDALEVGQVFRQVPGQLVVDADAAPGVDGDDHGQAGHAGTMKGRRREGIGDSLLHCNEFGRWCRELDGLSRFWSESALFRQLAVA